MAHVIPVDNWGKGSQWVVLTRKHAEVVVNDTTVFPMFQQHCRRKSLPEFWRDRSFVRTLSEISKLCFFADLLSFACACCFA
ncbi:hypothetical protein QYF36_000183 [Acer negundo]|nr:hypothetical protein QYF36_000183 [Acer negundo]